MRNRFPFFAAAALLVLGAKEAYVIQEKPTDFYFEFIDVRGPADVAAHLKITGTEAVLFHQPAVPEPYDYPIGVFRATLQRKDLQQIERAFEEQITQGINLVPDNPSMSFHLKSPKRNIDITVSPSQLGSDSKIARVVTNLRQKVAAKPYRTLKLEWQPPHNVPQVSKLFELTLRMHNAGVKPIELKDEFIQWVWSPVPPTPTPGVTPLPVSWEQFEVDRTSPGSYRVAGGGHTDYKSMVTFQNTGALYIRAEFCRPSNPDPESAAIGGCTTTKAIMVNVKSGDK